MPRVELSKVKPAARHFLVSFASGCGYIPQAKKL
jgi:hypothetical protein